MHDIICPNCFDFFSVHEPHNFFEIKDQKCSKCGNQIKTGDEGLEEQVILHLKRDGRAEYAEMLYYWTTQKQMDECEKYVKDLAVKHNITLKSKKCFIATACYDSPLMKEVLILKDFRDEILLRTYIGRFFVNIYYFLSPPLACIFKRSSLLRKCTLKYFLNPLIKRISRKV